MAEPMFNANDAGSPVESLESSPGPRTPPPLPGTPPDEGLLPGERDRGNPRLNSAAESIGSALASVRSRLRVVRGGRRSSVTGSLSEAAGATRERVSELTDQAGETVSEWQDSAEEFSRDAARRLNELSRNVRSGLYSARRRANHLADEYPLHTLVAFGALAFIVGATLRIWRSNGH